MERKIMQTLLEWKADPLRKALLIKGARQVGKTYIVTEFGKRHYRNFLRLDLLKERNRSIFDVPSVDRIMMLITTAYPDFVPEKGETLLFLDEIQQCPNAEMAMKDLVLDGRMDVIGSGSLLGLHYNPPESYPVGSVREVMMHPMDFEEYLWALGMSKDNTDIIRDHVSRKEPFDPAFYRIMHDYFRQYLVVGGMPEPVKVSVETGVMGKVIEAQEMLISGYRNDIYSYSEDDIKNEVRRIFDLVPYELSRSNKRLMFTNIEDKGNVGLREYREPIDWLEGSWFVNTVPRLRAVARPLRKNINPSMFKMYLLDTGILVQILGDETRNAMMDDDLSVNEGAVAENVVCSMLVKNGIPPYYYEKNKEMEIDFIAVVGADLCAIEVKSGKNRKAASLKKLMTSDEGKQIQRWIKFEYGNIMVSQDGVEHYPLFCASFVDAICPKREIGLRNAGKDGL